jgi:hypothetical protein
MIEYSGQKGGPPFLFSGDPQATRGSDLPKPNSDCLAHVLS